MVKEFLKMKSADKFRTYLFVLQVFWHRQNSTDSEQCQPWMVQHKPSWSIDRATNRLLFHSYRLTTTDVSQFYQQ
jgi:hypothetical protein